MHFRILKMIATSGFLTALECTKFVFGRGSAPDPAEGAYSAPPDPLAGLRWALLLRVRGAEGEGKGREGKGKGRDGRGRGGKGRGREGKERREGEEKGPAPPLLEIPGSAPGVIGDWYRKSRLILELFDLLNI